MKGIEVSQEENNLMVRPNAELPICTHHDLLQVDDLVQFTHFLWRHKWRLILGIASGMIVGLLYWAKTTPIYEAKAQLLIEKKAMLAFEGVDASVSHLREDASAHIAVIKSPWFVGRVVKEHDLRLLSGLAECKDPIRTIIGSLTVTDANGGEDMVGDSIVLQLAYRRPVAEETPVVLNAIMETYKLLLDESRRTENEDALKLIANKAEQVQMELRKLEDEYRAFRGNTPLALHPDGDTRLKDDRLLDLQARSSAVKIRRAEVERRLTEVKAAVRSGGNRGALVLVPDSFKREAYHMVADRYKALEDSLLPLLIQEKTLLRTYGPGYRQVKDIREQISLTRALLAPESADRKQLLAEADANYDVQWVDPIQSYIQSLEQELGDIATSEMALAAQLAQEQEEAKKLADYQFEERRYAGEIARAASYYAGLTRQLQVIDLGKDSGGYDTVILGAADRAVQVAPRLLLVIAASGFIGIAMGFGLAVCSQAADQTFRGTTDVHRRLHVPVLGQVPLLPSRRSMRRIGRSTAQEPDQMLCTHYQPYSPEAETYRAIRTALYFNDHGRVQKVIQIASPNVGDGKSTLAANLAVSMAQSGKNVLLIDADLRCPRLDEMFGVSAEVGLSSLLLDEAELTDAIQPSGTPRLSLLASGPIQPNAADLFSTPRFQELIAAVRERFDYVLIDTPALLAVTDPQVVAAAADGVLMTIRPSRSDRPNAERAVEILRMLDANLIGVVVNATRFANCEQYGNGYDLQSGSSASRRTRQQRRRADEERALVESGNGKGTAAS